MSSPLNTSDNNNNNITAPPGTYLCYGDLIYIEVKGSSLVEGCPHGGFLGAEDLEHATQRYTSVQLASESVSHGMSAGSLSSLLSSTVSNQRLAASASDKRPLAIAPIKRRNVLPKDFFLLNIFQVIPGYGFEAAGEPVRYGNQIKLSLRSSGEVLQSDEKTTELSFATKHEYELNHTSKCFLFRVRPRYETRAEGEVVHFHDLVTLLDHHGRKIICHNTEEVLLASTPGHSHDQQVTGFYFALYTFYREVQSNVLLGGQVIQLYHKEDRCFMLASQQQQREEDVSINKLSCYVQDEIVLVNAASYWQIELVSNSRESQAVTTHTSTHYNHSDKKHHNKQTHSSSTERAVIKGPLMNGCRIRLRHLLTQRCLIVENKKPYKKVYLANAWDEDREEDEEYAVDGDVLDDLEVEVAGEEGGGGDTSTSHNQLNNQQNMNKTGEGGDNVNQIAAAGIEKDGTTGLTPSKGKAKASSGAGDNEGKEDLLGKTMNNVNVFDQLMMDEELLSPGGDSSVDFDIFELRLNYDHSAPIYRNYLDNAYLHLGDLIRLYHPATGRHIILANDILTNQPSFTMDRRNFDKDVFQCIEVKPSAVDIVLTGRKVHHGLVSFKQTIEDKSVSLRTLRVLMYKAANHLNTVTHEEGDYLRKTAHEHYPLEEIQLAYNACYELGLLQDIFQLAEDVLQPLLMRCQRHGADEEIALNAQEENLLQACYEALRLLLSKSQEVKREKLPKTTISRLVKQLNLISHLESKKTKEQYMRTLPIMQLVDAVHCDSEQENDVLLKIRSSGSSGEGGASSAGDKNTPSLPSMVSTGGSVATPLMRPEDVEGLLDLLYEEISRGKVPDPLPYKMLARMCLPQTSSSSSQQERKIDKQLQVEICRQLLASPFTAVTRKSGWSVFTYRTTIVTSTKHGEPALLKVCTAPWGQVRPTVRSSKQFYPVRPPEMVAVHMDDWIELINLRDSELVPSQIVQSHHLEKIFHSPEHRPYIELLRMLYQKCEWKSIVDLKQEEVDVYCDMMELYAALCAGRNIWTQRIIQRLLPVDHVLTLLENIQLNGEMNDVSFIRLLPLKTAALHFLYECYLNHAAIAPIPSSGKNAFRDAEMALKRQNSSLQEALIFECTSKVFSLFSQIDYYHADLTDDMTEHDLNLFLTSLTPIDTIDLTLHKEHLTNEILDSIDDYNEDISSLKLHWQEYSLVEKRLKLEVIQNSYHDQLGKLCGYTIQQRYHLSRLVHQFITYDASRIWEIKIQNRLLSLAVQPPEAVGGASLSGKGHIPHSYTKEINLCIDYFNGFMRVLRALMLRQFFDVSYNESPILSGDAMMISQKFKLSVPGLQVDDRFYHNKVTNHTEVLENPNKVSYRDITLVMLKLLRSWPGHLPEVTVDLHTFDERAFDEIFLKLLGYHRSEYWTKMVEGLMGIKLQCVDLLSICLDTLHVNTARELRRVFEYIVEIVAQRKEEKMTHDANRHASTVQQESTTPGSTKASSRFENPSHHHLQSSLSRSIYSLLKSRKASLTEDEVKDLNVRIWTELHVRLVRSPEMIWNEVTMFQKDTFQTLFIMILYNQPQLRAQAMNLLYRINAHQAELNHFLVQEFHNAKVDESIAAQYLHRQGRILSQILLRFDRFFLVKSIQRDNVSLSLDELEQDDQLLGYSLQIKKLLLTDDFNHGDIGIINFIFNDGKLEQDKVDDYLRHDPGSDSGMLKVALAATTAKVQRSIVAQQHGKEEKRDQQDDEQKQGDQSAGRGKSIRKLAVSFHIVEPSPNEARTILQTSPDILPNAKEKVNMGVDFDKIFDYKPDRYHQVLLVENGLVDIVVDFLVSNASFIVSKSRIKAQMYHQLVTQPHKFAVLHTYRCCILILRAVVFKNEALVEKVMTAALLSCLLKLRNLIPDSIELIISCIHANPSIVNRISFADFSIVLDEVILSTYLVKDGHYHKSQSFSASKLGKAVQFLNLLICAEVTASRDRLKFFVSRLHDKSRLDSHKLFFHAIMHLGVSYRLPRTHGPMHDFDVSHTASQYQLDTDRATFPRMAKDVLSDPILNDEIYQRLRQAMPQWKLLPDRSAFKFHLDQISALGSLAHHSVELKKLCANFFPSLLEVLQIVLIDKYEIKIAYLHFLHGVWLSSYQSTVTTLSRKVFSPEVIHYFRALFYSFGQDLRFFRRVIRDDELRRSKRSDLHMFPRHITLLSRYIAETVVPFLTTILRSSLHYAMEPISNIEEEPKLANDGQPVPLRDLVVCVDEAIDVLCEVILLLPYSIIKNDRDRDAIITLLDHVSLDDGRRMWVEGAKKFLTKETYNSKRNLIVKAPKKADSDVPEPWVQNVRDRCLAEFVLDVDCLAKTNGYTALDHLIQVRNPNEVYVGDREYKIPYYAAPYDTARIAKILKVPAIQIVTNAMNGTYFRFAQDEISKILINFLRYTDVQQCELIMSAVKELPTTVAHDLLPNLKEQKHTLDGIILTAEEQKHHKDSDSHHRHEADNGHVVVVKSQQSQLHGSSNSKHHHTQSSSHVAHDKNTSAKSLHEVFNEHFRTWSRHGGMILEKIVEHFEFSLDCYASGGDKGLENTTITLKELIRCNDYWTAIFTKGLLRNRAELIEAQCEDQTELGISLQRIEKARLSLLQNQLGAIGVGDLVVKQLSMLGGLDHRSLSKNNFRTLQNMAMELGIGLNEGGNPRIQKKLIGYIREDYLHAINHGDGTHLLKVARKKLREYIQRFANQTTNPLYQLELEDIGEDVKKLLKFFSLLCEGHNEDSQSYLGQHDLVGDIAAFVSEIGRILANEIGKAMLADEEVVNDKIFPTILGQKRSIIKWMAPHLFTEHLGTVSPASSPAKGAKAASSAASSSPAASTTASNQSIDMERISLLTGIMISGCETLAEFCQGPRPEIQLIIARAGATKDFATFFEFMGAFHLITAYRNQLGSNFKSESLRDDYMNVYKGAVDRHLTYEGVIDVPEEFGFPPTISAADFVNGAPSSINDGVFWHGNNPLGCGLLFSVLMENYDHPQHGAHDGKQHIKALKQILSNDDEDDLTNAASIVARRTSRLFFRDAPISDLKKAESSQLRKFKYNNGWKELHKLAHGKDLYLKARYKKLNAEDAEDYIESVEADRRKELKEEAKNNNKKNKKKMQKNSSSGKGTLSSPKTGSSGMSGKGGNFSTKEPSFQRRSSLIAQQQNSVASSGDGDNSEDALEAEMLQDAEQNNMFVEISEFEKLLVTFEQSAVKFLLSLLEGQSTKDASDQSSTGYEISHVVMSDVGCVNLVCNMANYWNRFLTYNDKTNTIDDPDECYERALALDYYSLVMRILDNSVFANSIGSGSSGHRKQKSILDGGHIDPVIAEQQHQQETTSSGGRKGSKMSNFNMLTVLKNLRQLWLDTSDVNIDDHVARVEVKFFISSGSSSSAGAGINENASIAVAYFPKPQLVKKYWTRGDLLKLQDSILFPRKLGTRDSADEKVKNFLKEGRYLIATLRHLEVIDEIYSRQSFVSFIFFQLVLNMSRVSDLTTLIAVVLNIIVIMAVKSNERTGQGYEITNSLLDLLVFSLGIAMVCTSGLMCVSYFVLYGWLHVKLGLKRNPDNEFVVSTYGFTKTFFTLYYMGLLGTKRPQMTGDNILLIRFWSLTASLFYLFSEIQAFYYIGLMTFSLVGLLISPLFYSVCLMEILRQSKLMQYVTNAFTANLDQVIAVIILAAIITYFFTIWSFASPSLHNKYTFNTLLSEGCYSLETCLRGHLDYTLVQPIFWTYPHELPTFNIEIFNFLIVFIIQIVIPGLVSGIIIDTFSQMRGDKKIIEDDVMNNCFICNIPKDDFEAANVNFERHIKDDHNIWKYLWWLIYLDEKESTEYDGIEQYCAMQPEESTQWVPIRIAKALSSVREKYDLFTLYSKVNSLQTNLTRLQRNLQKDMRIQQKALKDTSKQEGERVHKDMKAVLDNLLHMKRDIDGILKADIANAEAAMATERRNASPSRGRGRTTSSAARNNRGDGGGHGPNDGGDGDYRPGGSGGAAAVIRAAVKLSKGT